MLFSMKLVAAVAALNLASVLATPTPEPALALIKSSEKINVDGSHPELTAVKEREVEERDVEKRWSGAYCDSGDTASNDQWNSAIGTWCAQYGSSLQNPLGTTVTYKNSVSSQFSGMTLANGNPATFNAGYYNDHLKDGWQINENDCNTWMKDIVTRCISKGKSTGGEYGDQSKGSLWIGTKAN
ncbi:hypothetical protein MMC06_000912 [Schaereria dolodes]|nr:hypothetical protein [Schaereria dolodes]